MALALAVLAGGCGREVDAFPEPGSATESAEVIRSAAAGPVVVTFVSFPLRAGAPPDGVRAAAAQAIGRAQCSAATFYWSERVLAQRWIREQLEARRRAGTPPRLILAGHGLGATEASETAREFLRDQDVEILLLLTVDAVKTGKIYSAAGAAGAATVGKIPGINVNFVAYDGAPSADGVRLRQHVNYYLGSGKLYVGAPMPGAENHRLNDWTGLLTHGNADDFVRPYLTADIRAALAGGMR